MGRRFLIERARRHLRRQIAVQHLFDVLPDVQRVEHLHIREAVEKDDALDELVGVLHFLDQFLAPLLGQILVAPIFEQPIVQPVLVDRGQFVPKCLVEKFDDFSVTLHNQLPVMGVRMNAPVPPRALAKNMNALPVLAVHWHT